MENWFKKQWVGYTGWHILLLPLSWLFGMIVYLRRFFYQTGWLKSYRLNVPVIVVGNINVGGTGKTPLVIWLAEQLKLVGYRPGIISRGYGGQAEHVTEVFADSNASVTGDEPVLIAARTRCPVFVGVNRIAAGEHLLASYPECNVIISDDGLQHYRLQRDVEIIVYDGTRGLGNRALLPAGPLRESAARLAKADAIVINGAANGEVSKNEHLFEMQLESTDFYNLADIQQKFPAQAFFQQKILAIAGIGNPERFFDQLTNMGLRFEKRAYADHYQFQPADFEEAHADVVLMTEKDAVKCRAFAQSNFWVLPVSAVLKNGLMAVILNKLNSN